MAYQMIDYNLSDLLMVFDKMLPMTDEERKLYDLGFTRMDGVAIHLIFDAYERRVSLTVQCNNNSVYTSVSLSRCSQIRVLDLQKRQLEIIATENQHSIVRCFLWLDGDRILDVAYQHDE